MRRVQYCAMHAPQTNLYHVSMQAKTYYISGVVLRSLRRQAATRKETKKLVAELDTLSVDMRTAVKYCLPTRHVTLKSRGGLLFASKEFYHLIAKVEDRFYGTVRLCLIICFTTCFTHKNSCNIHVSVNMQVLMRQNFALASEDAIVNIKCALLTDVGLFREFREMLSPALRDVCAEVLWELVVARMSNLFGTEAAGQMMDELASQKRKKSAPKRAKSGMQFAQPPKFEQLRFAKMQKKIKRNFEVEDLTLDNELLHSTEDVQNSPKHTEPALDHALGDEVTAIEGTGSATRQYKGAIVEIDHEDSVYIICCWGVSNYPNGYNMVVPFTESHLRINQQVHTHKRKRKRKVLMDL